MVLLNFGKSTLALAPQMVNPRKRGERRYRNDGKGNCNDEVILLQTRASVGLWTSIINSSRIITHLRSLGLILICYIILAIEIGFGKNPEGLKLLLFVWVQFF
jgi:hypothetical protein